MTTGIRKRATSIMALVATVVVHAGCSVVFTERLSTRYVPQVTPRCSENRAYAIDLAIAGLSGLTAFLVWADSQSSDFARGSDDANAASVFGLIGAAFTASGFMGYSWTKACHEARRQHDNWLRTRSAPPAFGPPPATFPSGAPLAPPGLTGPGSATSHSVPPARPYAKPSRHPRAPSRSAPAIAAPADSPAAPSPQHDGAHPPARSAISPPETALPGTAPPIPNPLPRGDIAAEVDTASPESKP